METNYFDNCLRSLKCTTRDLLINAGFQTVADLVTVTEDTLKKIDGFGEKELQDCVWLLKRYGVDFYGSPKVKIGTKKIDNVLDQNVVILQISNRSKNCLRDAGIKTIGDLVKQSQISLRRLPNLGIGSLSEILFELHLYGLKLPFYKEPLDESKLIEKLKIEDITLEDLVKEINSRGFSVTLTVTTTTYK